MATRIKHKRSSISGNQPTISQLESGELALNTADGKVFLLRDDNTVQDITKRIFENDTEIKVDDSGDSSGSITININGDEKFTATNTSFNFNNDVDLRDASKLTFRELDASGAQGISLKAPDTLEAGYDLTLPGQDGTVGQLVRTDGNGQLQFVDADFFGGNVFYVSAEKGNDINDGQNAPVQTVKRACQLACGVIYNEDGSLTGKRVNIKVAVGEYTEQNPIIIPDNTVVKGDGLRGCIVRPANANEDMFRVRNACYFGEFTFRDGVDGNGVPTITADYAVAFDDPFDTSASRTGYTNLPSSRPSITTSPYIQNCSIISFLGMNGAKIDGSKVSTPNVPLNAIEAENPVVGAIPEQGKSMVANAFTMLSFGGTGWRLLNDAYAQIVSCFEIFMLNGVYCQSGGYCSITNSATNFGLYALRSSGYSPKAFEFDRGYVVETGQSEGQQTLKIIGIQREAPVEEYVLRFRDPDYKIAYDMIQMQKQTLTDDMITWINAQISGASPSIWAGFTYNEDKCFRDTQILVDAVRFDLLFNSNYRSINAAKTYYQAVATNFLNNQLDQSVEAFTQAKQYTSGRLTDATAISRSNNLWDEIIDIVENGTGNADAYSIPDPTGYNSSYLVGYGDARAQIIANNTFIKEEILAWTAEQVADEISPFTNSYTYNATTLENEIEYILQALRYDLTYGGNLETINAARAYFATEAADTEAQKLGHIAILERLKDISGDIVQEIAITKTAANAEIQDVSGTPASVGVAAATESLIQGIADYVDTSTLPTTIRPGFAWANAVLQDQALGILDDAELVQISQEVIEYINNQIQTNIWYNFTYDQTKCERDALLILDAVAKDVWATGNTFTRGAGLAYYYRNLQDSSLSSISGQELQTIASIDELKSLTNTMLNGYSINADARTFTDSRFEIITTIINDPSDLPDPREVTSEGELTNSFKTTPTTINFNASSAPNAGTDVFTIESHGLVNGQKVTYDPDGNTDILGLDAEQTYYIKFISVDEFSLTFDDSLTFNVDVRGTGTGTHRFLADIKEFFVDDLSESHQTYQKLTLAAGNEDKEFVPGRAIAGTVGVVTNSAYVYSWKPEDLELIVSIEQVLVGSTLTRVQFGSSDTINEDHQGTPATDIVVSAVEAVTNLGTADFTITPTTDGEELSNLINLPENQVWFHRPSIVNSSSHTWEYAGSGTDYNALPQNGGNTKVEFEQFEELPGRVYSSGTNELGDFKVGDFITAFNRTGNITFKNKVQVDELDALKLSVSDVAIEEISTSANLGDDEIGGPSNARISTQLATRSFLSNRLGQFIDKAVSTAAVPGAIVQLNSNGQLNAELIPATRSFVNATGNGYLSRTEFVNDIPALDLSGGDIGTENYEQQELTLSGTASWVDGDIVTQAGRPNAIGYAKGNGNNTTILIVASQSDEWISGDDSTGSEWIAGSGFNISINGSDTGNHVTSLGGSAAQTDNYFLRTANTSQYLILDQAAPPDVTFDLDITNVSRSSNVITVTTTSAHDFNVGTSVRVTCTSDSTYTTSGRVLSAPTTTTFTLSNTGSDEVSKAATGNAQTTLVSADSSSQGAVTDLVLGVCLNVDNTNITSGSLYTPSVGSEIYYDVSLTNVSSSGTGAKANITVQSGSITDVDLIRGGSGYEIGDTLSCSASDVGSTGSGFEIEILSVEDRLFVDILGGELFVASASSIDFSEDNSGVTSAQTITLTDEITHNFLAGTTGAGGQVNYTTSRITITSHGLSSGDPILYDTLGNVAIGGLVNGQVYYAKEIDTDTIEIYADYALTTQITFLSTPANNNHNFTRETVSITDNSIIVPAHGLEVGDAIRIEGASLFAVSSAALEGGERFFIGSVTTNSFTLHSLRSDAIASINGLTTNPKDLTAVGSSTADIIPQNLRIQEVVNTSSRIKDNWSSLAVTNIDADNIVSGTIGPSRLASSGVANTETFLRGDSTYAEVVQHLVKANTLDNPITLTGLNVGGEFYEDVSIGIANVDLDTGASYSTLGTSRYLQTQFDVAEDGSGQVFIKAGVIDAGTLDSLDSSYFLNPSNLTSAVPVSKGGTALTTYSEGDMIYASGASTITTLSAGIPGSYLTQAFNNGSYQPEWNTDIFVNEGLDVGSARITTSSSANAQIYNENATSVYIGGNAENMRLGKRTTNRDLTAFIDSFEANNVTSVAVNLKNYTKTTNAVSPNGSNYVQISDTTDLVVGQILIGTSIPANTTVSGIAGNYVFLSNNTTGSVSNGANLTFTTTPVSLGISTGDSVTIANSTVTNLDGNWFVSGATDIATSFTVKVDNAVSTTAATPLAVGVTVTRDNTIVIENENVILGGAEASVSPNDGFIKGESGIGNNIAGGDITIQPGLSTGNATGGAFIVKTGEEGTSGDSQQVATTRMTIDTSGVTTYTGDVKTPNLLPAGGDNTGVVGNASNTWSNGHFTNFTVDSTLNVRGAVDLADNDVLRLGSSDDAKMFYDGTGNVLNIELESAATKLSVTDNGTERFSIAKTTGNTSVGGNLTVVGDLEVQGSTTTLNTATLAVEDKNIEIAKVTSPTDTTADGAGITIKGATDKLITWNSNTGYFTTNQDWNLTSGKAYYVNDVSVLNSTTLGTGVVTSSLTTVGTIGTGVWQGSVINSTYGGTGVNNGGSTITVGGNLSFGGAFTTAFTVTGDTTLTLPTSGTVATTSNNLGNFASTTSAELRSVISDETGTGAATFATSPSFTTGINAASATMALFDTTATTVNAFGTGTTINIGSSAQTGGVYDGTTTINHNLSVAGEFALTGTLTTDQVKSATTNGDLTLVGNGTGKVIINDPLDVTGAITGDSLASRTANTDLTLSANGTGAVYVNDTLKLSGNITKGTGTITVPNNTSGTMAIGVSDTTGQTGIDLTLSATGTISGTLAGLGTAASPTFSGLTLSSATSSAPVLTLTNSNADAQGPTVRIGKTTTGEADNDDLADIEFFGKDSGNVEQTWARIRVESDDITNSTRDSSFQFQTYSNNVFDTKLTIGNGVTVADTLTVEGSVYTKSSVIFEGATDNGFETTVTVTDPTADRTITLPNAEGTVVVSAGTSSTQSGLDLAISATGQVSGSAEGLATTDKPSFAGITTTATSTMKAINTDSRLTIAATDLTEAIRIQGDANDSPFISFYQGASTRQAFIQWVDSGDYLRLVNDFTDEELRIKSGSDGLTFVESGNERTVYHSGNIPAYLTAEADTLDTVTDRGASTTNNITVGNITSGDNVVDKIEIQNNIVAQRNSGRRGRFRYSSGSGIDTLSIESDSTSRSNIDILTSDIAGAGRTAMRLSGSKTRDSNSNVAGQVVEVFGDLEINAGRLSDGDVSIEGGLGVGIAATRSDGDIRATGEITAYASSDARLKENVTEITNALDKVKAIRGVTFDWTDEHLESKGGEDDYFARKHDVGVIAQEIEEVLPEAVAEKKDGYKGVRYEKMVPLLIEAIKDQQNEIDELKEMVKKLLDK